MGASVRVRGSLAGVSPIRRRWRKKPGEEKEEISVRKNIFDVSFKTDLLMKTCLSLPRVFHYSALLSGVSLYLHWENPWIIPRLLIPSSSIIFIRIVMALCPFGYCRSSARVMRSESLLWWINLHFLYNLYFFCFSFLFLLPSIVHFSFCAFVSPEYSQQI